jgi:hypothetical protein
MNFLNYDLNSSDFNKKFSINFTEFFKLSNEEIEDDSDSDK